MFIKYKKTVINMDNIVEFYLNDSIGLIEFFTVASGREYNSIITLDFWKDENKNISSFSSLSEDKQKAVKEIAIKAFDLIVRALESQSHTGISLFDLERELSGK
jgi:hypothetical protein